MTIDAHSGERWGTRVGLILAMAGNAVGLGNFLRFPVQAAQNGGGTFMIPYFISFLLLGIPLMWVEWGIGRYGGRFGHGTVPGMWDAMWKNRMAKYLGVLGIVMPLVVFIYYTYAVSWMAGFSWFSIAGDYFGQISVDQMRGYLVDYQNIFAGDIPSWITLMFFVATLGFVTWILSRGLSGGIEKLALIGLPILFIFAFILMIRVLTLPATDQGSVSQGLNFIWNPEWTKVLDAKVWLAAAGQMFFTLSLGMGTIHCYASYLGDRDDVTLTGLATGATNEFAEIVLGGTVAIPAAVVFFGVSGTEAVAAGGTFDLGIVAMSVVFQQLPGPEFWGQIIGFFWFGLLFIAGITSSVALASPAMAFMQEEYGFTRRKVAWGVGIVAFVIGMMHVVLYTRGWYAEWDYWAGTFGLVIFATIEILIFSFIFGIDRGWKELHDGADIRIPGIYRVVIKWITPIFLVVLLFWWTITEAVPTLLMTNLADQTEVGWRWGARLMIVAMLAVGIWLIHKAWSRRDTPVEGARPYVE